MACVAQFICQHISFSYEHGFCFGIIQKSENQKWRWKHKQAYKYYEVTVLGFWSLSFLTVINAVNSTQIMHFQFPHGKQELLWKRRSMVFWRRPDSLQLCSTHWRRKLERPSPKSWYIICKESSSSKNIWFFILFLLLLNRVETMWWELQASMAELSEANHFYPHRELFLGWARTHNQTA